MKSIFLSLFLILSLNVSRAQNGFSVEISLKDGSVVKGNVVEYKKDDYIILEIGTGRNLKFLFSEISSLNSGSSLNTGKEKLQSEESIIHSPAPKWSFGINQLTGIGIGGGNSKLLNISPSIRTQFSVSPFLQIGLGIGYSNIQSNEKTIILRTGAYYAYPNENASTYNYGLINTSNLNAISSPKSTSYELINSMLNFRFNFSGQNKPVQFFSEFGLGFGYAVQKDLNLEMESDLFTGMGWYVDPITSMNIYQPYSFKYYSNFRSRYSNALLLELGTGVRFNTIKKQNVEFKLSYQNTRGNINYTTTRPYAKAIEGYVPSFLPTEIIDLKDKDFLNLSFIAFSIAYNF
jgi:hypothetical protein